MRDYVDTEAISRSARIADSAAESMHRSANTAVDAADRMTRAAQRMEDAATRIAHLLEDGYGGNGLRLIELLECVQSPELALGTVKTDLQERLSPLMRSAVELR